MSADLLKWVHTISEKDANKFDALVRAFMELHPDATYSFYASAATVPNMETPIQIPGVELPQQQLTLNVYQFLNCTFVWDGEAEIDV